jgi:hypothetical protein
MNKKTISRCCPFKISADLGETAEAAHTAHSQSYFKVCLFIFYGNTPLEDCMVTENIIYKMLYCYASADIKLNASTNWLCVFRQQYYKKKLEPFQVWKKKI